MTLVTAFQCDDLRSVYDVYRTHDRAKRNAIAVRRVLDSIECGCHGFTGWGPSANSSLPGPHLADVDLCRGGASKGLLRVVGQAKADAMAGGQAQSYGGEWTKLKLQMLGEYLAAYAKVLKKQPFERLYIDAFAGTGYREAPPDTPDFGFFAPELAEDEPQKFFDGSARIALRVEPPFHRYIFVERIAKRFAELHNLKDEFPKLAASMEFIQGDGNRELQDLCGAWDRGKMRGVLFLDPFGMQVDWTTVEAVARTQAIDVWILFPLGIGVNRLLTRNGRIPDGWRTRLDRVFGTSDWYDAFYRPARWQGLFDDGPSMVKTGSLNAIAEYYQERLKTVFAAVAENPRALCNSRNSPLFLLCFAVGNPSFNAKKAALRIAHHILGKD